MDITTWIVLVIFILVFLVIAVVVVGILIFNITIKNKAATHTKTAMTILTDIQRTTPGSPYNHPPKY